MKTSLLSESSGKSAQPDYSSTPGMIEPEPRQTLRACVSSVLAEYLDQVDDDMITDMYAMVLHEVEAPLLEAVMRKARSNQCRAAHMLGLNRGTLRKKLKQYNLLE